MGETAERNQWYEGKAGVMREFGAEALQVVEGAAARNFSRRPGQVALGVTGAELGAKLSLSELNRKITAAAIERELAQTGHDYDDAYKQARIAWELEKAGLLTDLQQELADIDHAMTLDRETVARLAVALDIRKIVLVTTKASYDAQKETAKQQLVAADRLTWSKETELAAAKLATAQARLAVIPYIEAVIEAQERLLAAKTDTLDDLEDLIAARQLVAVAKGELIYFIEQKADADMDLADAIVETVAVKRQRLGVALSKAQGRSTEVSNEMAMNDERLGLELVKQAYDETYAALQAARTARHTALLAAESVDAGEISAHETTQRTLMDGYLVDRSASELDAMEYIDTQERGGAAERNLSDIDARANAIAHIQLKEDLTQSGKAVIAAQANITSNLVHLLTS